MKNDDFGATRSIETLFFNVILGDGISDVTGQSLQGPAVSFRFINRRFFNRKMKILPLII